MFVSSFLKKCGVKITPKIQALIDKFGDRCISNQFQKDFLERVRFLLKNDLFGDGFDYLSEEFMEKFPEFEVLFVKIWVLIHDIPIFPIINSPYFYDYHGHTVYITITDDSVQIVITNCDNYPADHVVNFTIC